MHLSVEKICVVVAEKTLEKFLVSLEKAQSVVNFVELRVDYIKDLQLEDIETIAKQVKKRAIFCCRALNQGGQFSGDFAKQKAILQAANHLNFDYIDMDLDIIEQCEFPHGQAKWIISYHDFNTTPTLSEFEQLAKRMRFLGADILKFAVMAHDQASVKRSFQFLLSKPKDEDMIMLSMGESGKPVRLLSPYLGGYLTFASLDETQTAPGQLDLVGMQALFNQMDQLLENR